MLRVLPPTFKPVNSLICCATSLFNSFFSNVARQVASFFYYPYLLAAPAQGYIDVGDDFICLFVFNILKFESN